MYKLSKTFAPLSKLHVHDDTILEVLGVREEFSFHSVDMTGPMHRRFTAKSDQAKPRAYLVILQEIVEMIDQNWQAMDHVLHAGTFTAN